VLHLITCARPDRRTCGFRRQDVGDHDTYALAYAYLSGLYAFAATRGFVPPNETWPKAKAAATKALELDSTLGHLYYHQMASLEVYYHRDWPAAERAFRHSIDLNPNDGEVRSHYATFLMLAGRPDDARVEIRRAGEISPLSPGFIEGNDAAPLFVLYWSHRPDDLIAKCLQRIDEHPYDAFTHEMLGNAYEQKRRYDDAVAEWRKAMTFSGDDELAAILDRAHGESGYRGVVQSVWQKRLERLRQKEGQGEYVAAGTYARVYARLRDKEQALAWLDKAYEERNRLVLEAVVDPVYDDLRADPRFVDVLARLRVAR
jgi:tetratricopeptide (TPR) repeat protein